MTYVVDPHYPKNGVDTKMELAPGVKLVKRHILDIVEGRIPDIGKAPTSRVYTRDYCKIPEKNDYDNVDLVSPAIGNPLKA
jgi:hypothetical protein